MNYLVHYKIFIAITLLSVVSAYGAECEEDMEEDKVQSVYRGNPDKIFGIVQATRLDAGYVTASGGATFKGPVDVSGVLSVKGVPVGATGPQGPTGPTGSVGAAGPAGATGPAGAILGYGYMYNTNGSLIAAGLTNVPLADSGSFLNMAANTTMGSNGITVNPPAGTGLYSVDFYVQGTTGTGVAMVVDVAVGGVVQGPSTYASNGGGGTQFVVGRAFVTATTGQTISLVNNTQKTGMAGPDSITTMTNGSTTSGAGVVNSSLYVVQIA